MIVTQEVTQEVTQDLAALDGCYQSWDIWILVLLMDSHKYLMIFIAKHLSFTMNFSVLSLHL